MIHAGNTTKPLSRDHTIVRSSTTRLWHPCDLVLSLDEHDAKGRLEPQCIVGVKCSFARIWHVHFKDQVIRTSASHPFFVKGKGWTAAGALKIGDEIRELEGGWIAVSDLCDAGIEETVFNIRVAVHHTYFVGRPAWGFAVWVHNAIGCEGADRHARDEALENGELTERSPEWLNPQNWENEEHHPLDKAKGLKEFWEKRGLDWKNDVKDWTETLGKDVHQGISAPNPALGGKSFWDDQLFRAIDKFENEKGEPANKEELKDIAKRILEQINVWAVERKE